MEGKRRSVTENGKERRSKGRCGEKMDRQEGGEIDPERERESNREKKKMIL